MKKAKKPDIEFKRELFKSRIASTKSLIIIETLCSILFFGIWLYATITSFKTNELIVWVAFSVLVGGIGFISALGVYRQLKQLKFLNIRLKIVNRWEEKQKHL